MESRYYPADDKQKKKKTTIWVLEDNDTIRNMIMFLLTDIGFEVRAYDTVSKLLNHLHLVTPEMFILDIHLPDGNGIDICLLIRASNYYDHIPILLISADADASFVSESFNRVGFMSKPFELKEFYSKVHSLLNIVKETNTDQFSP
nr:response regulator [Pedobacter sp. ASV2]